MKPKIAFGWIIQESHRWGLRYTHHFYKKLYNKILRKREKRDLQKQVIEAKNTKI